jgi:hypothetical protein
VLDFPPTGIHSLSFVASFASLCAVVRCREEKQGAQEQARELAARLTKLGADFNVSPARSF